MNKKVLIIGTYSTEGVDSFDWWQELPNISDYVSIILDTTRIYNYWAYNGRLTKLEEDKYVLSNVNEQDEKIKANILLVRKKLIELLEFNVQVYALYSPAIIVYIPNPRYVEAEQFIPGNKPTLEFCGTNDWLPISVETVIEKGKIIHVKDDSYSDYFRDFKGWEYYFVPDSLQIDEFERYYGQKWKVIFNHNEIATNNVDKPIAIEFCPSFHRWVHDIDEPEEGWHSLPEKYGGILTLLPTTDSYNTTPFIEILLQRGKEFEETPPPTWADDIEVPGEASLKREIAAENEKLSKVKANLENLEASLHEIWKYKRLLYDTGLSLQDGCVP